MLLDDRHEMLWHVAVREHHGLAEHRAHLGAADIEHVARRADVLDRHVVAGGGQRVAETRAVDEQRHVVLRADLADRLELGQRVQRAVFGGLRNVHAAGEHHMRVVAVRVERGAVFVEFIRVDFAVMVGEREHFVAGEFDSARLMHVHMSGGGRHHARIRWGDGVDDDLVGLSAADEEEDFGVRACAGLADFGFGAFADVVGAVAGILVGRGFGETGDDSGVAAQE